jgi:hypothetical protein
MSVEEHKETLLLGIDMLKEVTSNPHIYKGKDILFSGDNPLPIDDEITITTDMNLSFDFQNEIVCKKILIKGCTVEIQGLNLRGSIYVETGILNISLSAIHNPPPEADYLLSLSTLSGVHASKCFFTDTDKYGISVDQNSALIMENCQVNNTKLFAISVTGNSLVSCNSCLISNTEHDSIFTESHCQIRLRSTKISESKNHAISAYSLKSLTVENCILKNCQQGCFYIVNCQQGLISNSQFSDIGHTALYFENTKVVVKKSAFLNCNGNGINASLGTTIIVSSTSFKSTTFPPIAICQSSVDLIKKCNLSDSKMSGIIIRSGSCAAIRNCNIEAIEQFGVSVSDSNSVTIQSSLFVGCKYACIGCYNHSIVDVEKSYLIGPGRFGIDVFVGGILLSNDTTFVGFSDHAIYTHHGGSSRINTPLVDKIEITKREDVSKIINKIDISKRGEPLEEKKIYCCDTKREFAITNGFVVGYGAFGVTRNFGTPPAEVPRQIVCYKCLLCGKNKSAFFCQCGHNIFCQECFDKSHPSCCPLCLMPVEKTTRPIDQTPDGETDGTCGICFENRTDCIIIPCGHTICLECAKTSFKNSSSCPFCRESISKYTRMFSYE